jgi:hypothetical protein
MHLQNLSAVMRASHAGQVPYLCTCVQTRRLPLDAMNDVYHAINTFLDQLLKTPCMIALGLNLKSATIN